MVNLSEIHFHDSQIKRVIEDIESHTLMMEIDYPVDWEKNVFAPRSIVFENCYNYRVFEEPFSGHVTILDAELIGDENGWNKVELKTNMGRRELLCKSVHLL